MDRPLILYLHGFTSGPQSQKARLLAARMSALGLADRLLCPQLPAAPAEAIAHAESLLDKSGAGGTAITVIGSSLGGYYATYLAETRGLRAVLINPAVVAALSLERYLGPQTWIYTGEPFELTHAHLDQLRALEVPRLRDPSRYWLLVETGDEVLDHRLAVTRYAGARQTVLPGGDHGFSRWHEYLDAVIAYAGLT